MQLKEGIDFEATLFCGQTFAWKRVEGGFIACIEDNAAFLSGCGNLSWEGPADEAYWARYFDLFRDYPALVSQFSHDDFIARAYSHYPGLRVLNQPIWETLAAFIVSANNNIKRITGILFNLSKALGKERQIFGHSLFTFPEPCAIAEAGEDALFKLGLGYRAPYLYETAKLVNSGFDLNVLPSLGYEAAHKSLLSLKGVGPKVADCILLFSCGYAEALPVDLWVKRVLELLYGLSGTNLSLRAKGREYFGAEGGIVTHFLFHGARMGLFKEQGV